MTRHDIIMLDIVLFKRIQSVPVRFNVRLYKTCIHYFVVDKVGAA